VRGKDVGLFKEGLLPREGKGKRGENSADERRKRGWKEKRGIKASEASR